MLRTFIVVALLLVPTLALAAPMAYNQKLEKSIEVKPLDDPANPYKDQYGDWDRWMIEHWYTRTDENPFPLEDKSINYYVLEGWVDADGWLLPEVELERLRCERLKHQPGNLLNAVFPYQFSAAGPMDEELVRAAHTAFAKVHAPYLPTIPQWLAEAPARWNIALPDGRFVLMAFGRGDWEPLGFDERSKPLASTFGWWMYDKDGNLIVATLPETYWFEATFPGFREAIGPLSRQYLNVSESWGRIHVYNMNEHDNHTLANYEYDGTPLPVNVKLPDGQNGNFFQGISGFDLPIIYAEQQRLAVQPASGL